jgi:predicted site-specific integrase-resolvase
MGDLLQDHNEQLQKYIMRTFAVKQRTLQRWFKAGVVPNVYRTKGVAVIIGSGCPRA